MYTTEEMRTQYRCAQCYTNCPTETMLKRHTTMCKIMHTSSYEHSIDRFYNQMQLPSQEAMVEYMFLLSKKCEELEEKVAKLQKAVIPLRRKTIQEYLEQLPAPDASFQEWTIHIEISDEDLETLFKQDMRTAIQQVLEPLLTSESPLRAFTQKPNTFYLYDKTAEWRLMTAEEFAKWIDTLERKFSRKYSLWAKEHQDELIMNPQAQERAMSYMTKLHKTNRVLDIKKMIYGKIATALHLCTF